MSVFPRLIAIFPVGVGLTLLVGLWGGGMGNPPLMFKLFGSFVCFFFITIGAGIFTAAGKMSDPRQLAKSAHEMAQQLSELQANSNANDESSDSPTPRVGYDCPNCGASIGEDADVSPSGDAKCMYCKRWFNIHNA